MNDLDFAALLVSRVCHDLVSPVGAVVNGLEILEDERDAAMRADAIKLVASSAEQAAARLQFARIAFGVGESERANVIERVHSHVGPCTHKRQAHSRNQSQRERQPDVSYQIFA